MDIHFTKHKKNVIILTCRGKNMKIGIDIDGVLTDLNKFQAEQGKKYFKNELQFFNECAFDFRDMFHCTKEKKDEFWKKNKLNYYLKAECDKYASKVTQMLKQQGHTIYLFTNRKETNNKGMISDIYKRLLKFWLANNQIEYDEIIYCDPEKSAEDKYYACKEKEIDIMIEDQKLSAYLESNICKVIIINRPYNIGVKLPSITRLNSFETIKNGLEELNRRKVKQHEVKHK